MYEDFHANHRWTKKQVHCSYQALIVAVATRHADGDRPQRQAVDDGLLQVEQAALPER